MAYLGIILREQGGKLEVLMDTSLTSVVTLKGSALEQLQNKLKEGHGPGRCLEVPLHRRTHSSGAFDVVLFWSESESAQPSHSWAELESIREVDEPLGSILCEALAKFWPLMPLSQKSLSSIHPIYSELKEAPQLTFYGGTFDPFHKGHMACLKLCPARPLIVVPDHNPQKKWRGDRSFWNLYQELKAEAQRVAPSGAYVYPGFCGSERGNPTVSWLQGISAKKNLLLGDDCFRDILTWKDAEQLIQLLNGLYVVPRSLNLSDFESHSHTLRSLNSRLKIERLPHHSYQNISSSGFEEK